MRADTMDLVGRGSGEAGRLRRQSVNAPHSTTVIRSDPAHPVADPFEGKFGAHDYRALKPGPNIAVYQTAPFPAPLEIIGRIVIELVASASVPDFDLWVQLYDVAPDRTAWNLSSPGTDVLRASWRESEAGKPRRPLQPREIAVLRLPNLRTGNLFAKGHRVRIVLCGSFMPDFSRNLQTGESETTSAKTRKAVIRIHHDSANASRIVLPQVPDEETR
jgi:putative CocE/NonD family hydrolase